MGGNSSTICSPGSDSKFEAISKSGSTGYKWFGFNVLTANTDCMLVPNIIGYKKIPNIFLYVSCGLFLIMLLLAVLYMRRRQ